MAEGDHTPNPGLAEGLIHAHLGGYVPNGLTTFIIDRYRVPEDCWVEAVYYSYTGGTADLDAVTLVTTDAAKTIVAAADMGNDLSAEAQTLHADVAKRAYQINAGDVITLSADSSGGNEAGAINVEIVLRPVYRGGASIGR